LTFVIGKRKVDYIESINKRIKTVHGNQSALIQLMTEIDHSYNDDPAPLHQFYREWFNLVDITNTYWYKVWDRHANQKWKSKLLFAIMKYFIINVWTWTSTVNYKSWKKFRASLALELTQVVPPK
jgi:hypothetical protein